MGARTFAENRKTFTNEKKEAIKIARDLCYKAITIERIKNATSSVQIERALRLARLG